MKNTIVLQGETADDQKFIIRYLTANDAEKMAKYINTLSQEKTYISYQGEELTLAQEKKNLAENLEKIKKHKCIFLLAFIDDELVGVTDADVHKRASSHVAEMGITVAKVYRGKGLGSLLLESLISEIKKNIPEIRLLTLQVFSINKTAISLYKKYGFIEYGHLPKSIHYKGKFEDSTYMYKKL